MKDIKTFLIGFLTCVCMFLIMGATYDMRGNGLYSFHNVQFDEPIGVKPAILNTKTGTLHLYNKNDAMFNRSERSIKLQKDKN